MSHYSPWEKSVALHEAGHAVVARILAVDVHAVVACRYGHAIAGHRAQGFCELGCGTSLPVNLAIVRWSGSMAGTELNGGTWNRVYWDDVLLDVCAARAQRKTATPPKVDMAQSAVVPSRWNVPSNDDEDALTTFGTAGRMTDLTEIADILGAACERREFYRQAFVDAWDTTQRTALRMVQAFADPIRRLADLLLDHGGRLTERELADFFEDEGF